MFQRFDLVSNYMGHTKDKTSKYLHDNVGGVIVLNAKYLVCDRSDNIGFEAVHAITEFLLKLPDPIGVILYGSHDSITKLTNLCPEFMDLFVEDVKEPNED